MFRLNPEMPREGMDRQDYLEAKFGGPEKAAEVYARIAEAAEASGLALALDRIERTPDTTDAHRVLHWAAAEGAAHAAAEALFRRYFVEGRDISEPAVLADAAEEAGMERAVVARLLEGEADREALLEEERAAREMGVTGVPCFVINGRHVLQGAQERDTWASVIRELDAALTARPGGEAE
jgi:predicted DsbA family dithiol-disulfide isomerase